MFLRLNQAKLNWHQLGKYTQIKNNKTKRKEKKENESDCN